MHKVSRVHRAFKDPRVLLDPQERLVQRVRLDQLELLARRACKVLQGLLVLSGRLAQRDLQALKAFKVYRVSLVPRELSDQQVPRASKVRLAQQGHKVSRV